MKKKKVDETISTIPKNYVNHKISGENLTKINDSRAVTLDIDENLSREFSYLPSPSKKRALQRNYESSATTAINITNTTKTANNFNVIHSDNSQPRKPSKISQPKSAAPKNFEVFSHFHTIM